MERLSLLRDNEGRYMKIRIRDNDTTRTIACSYLEPSAEVNQEIIPQSIKSADIIGADLNDHEFGLRKEGIYHCRGLKLERRVEVPQNVSDHPSLVMTTESEYTDPESERVVLTLDPIAVRQNDKRLRSIINGEIQ